MAAAGSLRRRGLFVRTTAVLATTIAVHAAARSHRQYHHHAFVLPACAHGRRAMTPRRPPFLAPPTTAIAARQAFRSSSSSPTARGSPRDDDDGQEDSDSDGGDQQPILIDTATRACWPELSEAQWDKLEGLANLLQEVNARINVISRKDFGNVVPNHILPALGLARLLHQAPKGTRVLDIGTGGGFPGLPLAIACPQLDLLLVDATGKKVRAVQAMAEALGLADRVQTAHARIEELGGRRFEYVVGRSVTAMPRFLQWARPKLLVPKPQSQRKKAGAEGEENSGGGVPAPGVLYITGLEPMAPAVNKEADEDLEEAPEPDSVTMIRDLMAPAYTGDKAVFHFSAGRLLQGKVYETADDGRRTFVRSRKMYDDGGRFRPEGEGLFAQAMREGRRDGYGGDEDMWGGEDGFGRGDRDDRGGGRGRRGPPRSGGRGGYGGGGGGYGDRRRSGGGGPSGGGGGRYGGGGGSRGGRPGTGMGGGSAGGGRGGVPPRGRSGPPR